MISHLSARVRAARLLFSLLALGMLGAVAPAAPREPEKPGRNPATPSYAPGRVVVKLTPGSAAAALGKSRAALSPGLRATMAELRVTQVKPLFRDLWKGSRPLRAADRARELWARFPRRAARVPQRAAVPDLENVLLFTLPQEGDVPAAAEALQALPEVVSARPDWAVELAALPNDPEYLAGNQWGLGAIHAPAAWDWTTGDPNVIIAVVDTGVAYTHPDLAGKLWTNPGEIAGNGLDDDGNGYVDDVRGWDCGSGDNDPMDEWGHGTLCAGAAAAATNNALGVAGVAWQCPVMAIKTEAWGWLWSTAVSEGIYYAANNGASVISLSLTGWGLEDAVRYALATGVTVVAAAGNYGYEGVSRPASLPGVIAVGASMDDPDHPRVVIPGWWSSQWGYCLDVLAPGHDIRSLELWSGGYASYDGTSLATPLTAGTAALMLSRCPFLTPQQIRLALRASASPGYTGTWNREWGAGVVNAGSAVQIALVPTMALQNPLPQKELCDSTYVAYQDQPVLVKGTLGINGAVGGIGSVSYTLRYSQGWDPDPATAATLAQGSTPASGRLAEIDTSALSPGTYNLDLAVVSTEGYVFREGASFFTDPTQHPGWPVAATWREDWPDSYRVLVGPFMTPPVLADLDRDGAAEIIQENKVFRGDGSLFPGWSADAPGVYAWSTVGDVDGDRKLEVVCQDDWGWPTITRWDGTPHPSWPTASIFPEYEWRNWSPAACADVDRDGKDEIIMGCDFRGASDGVRGVYAFKADGSQAPGWPVGLAWVSYWDSPAVGDLDGDGSPEVVVFSYYSLGLHAYHADGSAVAGWPAEVMAYPGAPPVLADLNGDRKLEVVLACDDGTVKAYDAAGRPLAGWPVSAGAMILAPPAVADLDGDNRLEVVVGAFDNRLYAWRADGSALPGWPVQMQSSCYGMSPVIGDVDGDRKLEVMVGTYWDWGNPRLESWAWIYGFEANGDLMPGYPKPSINGIMGMALGDVDGDNLAELVATSESYALNVWDLNSRYQRKQFPWPMTCGNAGRTSACMGRG